MNPIAEELNRVIENNNPYILEMLSAVGKDLFFPKGILSQSAEAKEKAHKLFAQGAAWIAEQRNDSKAQERFRAEAEELMGIDVSQREAMIEDYRTAASENVEEGTE